MTWAPDYTDLATLRSYMRVSDPLDDSVMYMAITAASRAIDKACDRQFGSVAAPEVRYYTSRYEEPTGRWVIDIDDLATTAGLAVALDVDGSDTYAMTVTGCLPHPLNAIQTGRVWTSLVAPNAVSLSGSGGPWYPGAWGTWVGGIWLPGNVKVTAQWGWPSVPVAIEQATLMQASRIVQRRDSPFGVTGSPSDPAGQLRLLSRLDPDVALLVRTYYRWWGAL